MRDDEGKVREGATVEEMRDTRAASQTEAVASRITEGESGERRRVRRSRDEKSSERRKRGREKISKRVD